ncbi:MAG: hypothetical protein AAF355_09085 [Myxococcota bacterium]
MATRLLKQVALRLEEEVDGLSLEDGALKAILGVRFSEVMVVIDHDEEVGSIRVSVAVPPPAGAGRSFLVFCLSLNTLYWDVKLGLDEDGALVVHSDFDAPCEANLDILSATVLDRIESILDVLNDDVVGWLLEHNLGTPRQRSRWESFLRDDDDEDSLTL